MATRSSYDQDRGRRVSPTVPLSHGRRCQRLSQEHPHGGRAHLKVESRRLRCLLLANAEPDEASGEGVGDSKRDQVLTPRREVSPVVSAPARVSIRGHQRLRAHAIPVRARVNWLCFHQARAIAVPVSLVSTAKGTAVSCQSSRRWAPRIVSDLGQSFKAPAKIGTLARVDLRGERHQSLRPIQLVFAQNLLRGE